MKLTTLNIIEQALKENANKAVNEYDSYRNKLTERHGEDWSSSDLTSEENAEKEKLLVKKLDAICALQDFQEQDW